MTFYATYIIFENNAIFEPELLIRAGTSICMVRTRWAMACRYVLVPTRCRRVKMSIDTYLFDHVERSLV